MAGDRDVVQTQVWDEAPVWDVARVWDEAPVWDVARVWDETPVWDVADQDALV